MSARERRTLKRLIEAHQQKPLPEVVISEVQVIQLPDSEILLSIPAFQPYIPRPRAYEGFGPLPKADRQEMDELNSVIREAYKDGDL